MSNQDRIFSLHYQINIRQASDDKIQMSIRGFLVDPLPNSLCTNTIRIVWQTVRGGITNDISEVKGLT